MSKLKQWWFRATPRAMVALVMACALVAPSQAMVANDNDNDRGKNQNETESPIKHVIVLIGENRTFDHVFATYVPKSHDSVSNLLSKGIINADGTPGPNFKKAQPSNAEQKQAILADLDKAKDVAEEVSAVIDKDHVIAEWRRQNP